MRRWTRSQQHVGQILIGSISKSMIQHHQGALDMVEDLLDQGVRYRIRCSMNLLPDVTSDQTSEIERMVTLLASFSSDQSWPRRWVQGRR